MLQAVQKAKVTVGNANPLATANPHHSRISAVKLAPETYSNNPPCGILYSFSPGCRKLRRMWSAWRFMQKPAKNKNRPRQVVGDHALTATNFVRLVHWM